MDKPKKPRFAVQVRCKDEIEQRAFHMIAKSRGLEFSDMIRLDYLQQKPKITFAPPERERVIKHLIATSNIISFIDGLLKKLNPDGLEIMELVKHLTNEQIIEYRQIEENRETALMMFLNFQSELNGRSQG